MTLTYKYFEASGDLRNTIETIIGISYEFRQKCEIIINDKDSNVVIRHTIMLLLAFTFPDREASKLIVHLWYSVSLPSLMWREVTEAITPLIIDFVNRIKEELDNIALTNI